MARSLQPRHVALRICKALYALKREELHWVSLEDVCRELDEVDGEAMTVALEYGR